MQVSGWGLLLLYIVILGEKLGIVLFIGIWIEASWNKWKCITVVPINIWFLFYTWLIDLFENILHSVNLAHSTIIKKLFACDRVKITKQIMMIYFFTKYFSSRSSTWKDTGKVNKNRSRKRTSWFPFLWHIQTSCSHIHSECKTHYSILYGFYL